MKVGSDISSDVAVPSPWATLTKIRTVSELCQMAPETPDKQCHLRGYADAHRCCVTRCLELSWWDFVCVSTRGPNRFPSVLLQPLGHLSVLRISSLQASG